MFRLHWLIPSAALALLACDRATAPDIESPGNLTYRLDASGDPQAPAGLLLEWDPVNESRLSVYRVYSRATDGAPFDLRASTTSTTFHDVGKPDLDYYVTAYLDNNRESARSNTVRIDERLRLPAPATLTSISLNGAVHLAWADNAFTTRPSGFRWYRVYSTSYSLDQNLCGTSWSIEGTTVSSEFLATNMSNGVPRCFAVSAESQEGFESLWSPLRADTPRPDARNILMYPFSVDPTRAGFRFWQDANGDGKVGPLELGIVADGNRTDIDFRIEVDASNRVWLKPVRTTPTPTRVAQYGNAPISDLTSIDVAPADNAFSTTAIEAVAGWGYVFKMSGGDQYARFGGLRIGHASKDYVIFDWSYQTDPGNPELRVGGGVNDYEGGVTVIQK
ncbi:MAG: hypothetical protein HY700_02985 [Gemmatimonadetes bacterium]|nr:hypothetical protein [Gemmatimonadota bacterium]